MQLNYNVDYELNGKKLTQSKIEASSPGLAIARCQKSNPGAKIIKAWFEGYSPQYGSGYQEWPAPPVQRDPIKEPHAARALKPSERGCEMPFYDEVKRT